MIIIDLVYILYEGLVIWKLVLSYKIKADGIPWFMAMDYVFLILDFMLNINCGKNKALMEHVSRLWSINGLSKYTAK